MGGETWSPCSNTPRFGLDSSHLVTPPQRTHVHFLFGIDRPNWDTGRLEWKSGGFLGVERHSQGNQLHLTATYCHLKTPMIRLIRPVR